MIVKIALVIVFIGMVISVIFSLTKLDKLVMVGLMIAAGGMLIILGDMILEFVKM